MSSKLPDSKLIIAYPDTAYRGCFGYIVAPSLNSYKSPEYCISVGMPFPVGNKTLEYSGMLSCTFAFDDLEFLPEKKVFSDYLKIELKSTETMPGKEEVVIIDESKQMNEYLSYLFDTYSYLRVTKDCSLDSIFKGTKDVNASLSVYRAKDVLPLEYQCEDCVVILLNANFCTQVLVLSNVAGLLDIDGEEFVNSHYTKSNIRDFFNEVFSAAKKSPAVKNKKKRSTLVSASQLTAKFKEMAVNLMDVDGDMVDGDMMDVDGDMINNNMTWIPSPPSFDYKYSSKSSQTNNTEEGYTSGSVYTVSWSKDSSE